MSEPYFYDCIDEAIDFTAMFEESILFSDIQYKYEPYDYFSKTQIESYPTDFFQKALVNQLSMILVGKHLHLGDDGLNTDEQKLLPLANLLLAFQRNYTLPSTADAIEGLEISNELEESILLLSVETKDKYFKQILMAIQGYKQNPSRAKIKRIHNKIKHLNLVLNSVEGRLPLRWILSKFKVASQVYSLSPASSKYLEEAGERWRESINVQLVTDGFSGEYPHFRRRRSLGCGEFISISELHGHHPDSLRICMTVSTAKLDKQNCLQGIPFAELTAYDCQCVGGRGKERYRTFGGNPTIYLANNLPLDDEQAKNHRTAWNEFEIHLEQVYRFLSGKGLDKEYKKQYGIKDNYTRVVFTTLSICLIMGLVWGLLFWLLFSLFDSLMTNETYLQTLLDPIMIKCCFFASVSFGSMLGLVFIIPMRRLPSRR